MEAALGSRARLVVVGVITLNALLAEVPYAAAERGCTFCATRSRADGRAGIDTIPRAGTASVTSLGVVGRGQSTGAGVISMMFGLPFYTAVEVDAAATAMDGDASVGDVSGSFLAYLGLDLPRGIVLKLTASMGAAAPVRDTDVVDVGSLRAASDRIELRSRLATTLIHPRRLSLGLNYEREGSRHEAGVTAGFVSERSDWSAHAGFVATFDTTRAYWIELATSHRPRWAPRWAVTLFGALDTTDTDAIAAGLALSYSFPVTRSATDPGDHLVGSFGRALVQDFDGDDGQFPISSIAVPGRITIIEFGAFWCTACRHLEPDLRGLAADREDVALVFIDADRFDDLFEFNGGSALPLVIVLDRRGNEIGRTSGNLHTLRAWLDSESEHDNPRDH
jgi:thiol-disulfide isomerase/thioredoxin